MRRGPSPTLIAVEIPLAREAGNRLMYLIIVIENTSKRKAIKRALRAFGRFVKFTIDALSKHFVSLMRRARYSPPIRHGEVSVHETAMAWWFRGLS